MKKVISILSFFLILYLPYIVQAAGVDELIEEAENRNNVPGYSVSDTARDVLDGKSGFTFSGLADKLASLLFGKIKENTSVILKMVAAGIISGIAASLCGGKNEIGTICCVAVVSLMSLKIFIFSMSAAEETIDTLFLFVQALMPSAATAAAATGQAAQSAACGVVFGAMQVFIHICKETILPLVAVITALSVVDCLGDTPYLKGVTGLLKSCLKWGTGLLLTLYGAVIAIQSQAAGAFDTVAGKTVKYAVGSFVPVVGGALSDSLEMVGTSARAIKSALGISGIIGVGYVCLSPLINVCAVALSYKLAACLCAVTAEKRVSHVIDEVGGSLVRICGVILAVSVMFVISLAMLCRFGGGAL